MWYFDCNFNFYYAIHAITSYTKVEQKKKCWNDNVFTDAHTIHFEGFAFSRNKNSMLMYVGCCNCYTESKSACLLIMTYHMLRAKTQTSGIC